ncbi:hypothetical protein G7Z17_g11688 [Cylindrodendrum hubeiense]|uniref:Calpain catalytic domain-containing protein n=1 Tax=Cylindrodendrum hubeiense TaxID=595255 RepID=A0A9P5H0I8_9HYPO|nr:hypothetical protein G7Z17_g11688 [Cylindrodendrum hubeiense]
MEPPQIPPPRPKPKPPLSPQALVSKFWSRYHAKAPGKVTSIFPHSLYEPHLPDSDASQSRARNAAHGYEQARSECRARVRAIVAECERTNSKFSDPDFDIETDFSIRADNCLYGLVRDWEDNDDDESKRDTKVRAWQVKMSLDTLKDSGVLGNDRLEIDVGNLRKYLGSDDDYYNMPPPRPGSVHRLPWIFESPRFTVDGFSGTDIKQGASGDCWWLAALATIAHRKDLMNKICVERDEECGVYGFVFHRDGEWISTVVDDNMYLKEKDFGQDSDVYDSTGKKARLYKKQKQNGSEALFFAKCDDANETWLPLLEKAFAKVHGDYKALDGGWAGTAVEDLTGGVTTVVAGNRVLRKERLWREMVGSGGEDGEFVFGLSAAGPGIDSRRNGLVLRHAYSIHKATEVENEEGIKFRLVKIRNPWGQRSESGLGEWHGPWSDGSKEWTPYMIQKLRHEFGDDGIFWMSYDDVLEHFKWIYRTRLFDQRWTVVQQWTSIGVSWLTGYLKKRFIIEVKEEGMVVIVLSQLDDRYFRDLKGQYDFTLQFLLKSINSTTPICHVKSVHTWDRRSINCEINLEPGTYEVVPNITAERDEDIPTVEKIVKAGADRNPQKLRQVGLQYDLAHAKGGVLDEDDELQKKRAEEKKKRHKKKKAQRANQAEQVMLRLEEAMLQMRKEMLRGSSGDGETKDKEESTNDKKSNDKDSKGDVTSSKPPPSLLPDDSFKTAAEAQTKGENNPKSKLESESSTLESTNKNEEDKKEELEASSSTSQALVTESKNSPPEKNAPNLNPDVRDVRDDPSTPPPEIKNDPEEDSSDHDSDSDSDLDSDSDDGSDISSFSGDRSGSPGLKKKKPWNAVCVLGLRVYAGHPNVKVRLGEQNSKDARSGLVTTEGNPVGPTS